MFVGDTPFDESEEVVFKIRKSKFVGELDHWYGQLYILGEEVCTSTGPNFWRVMDGLMDYLTTKDPYEEDDDFREWLEEDVNENQRRRNRRH